MVKLFALEDESKASDTLDKKELLIDKVIKLDKAEKTPLELTSEIIKQRSELKNELEQKLNAEDEENNDSSENDSSNNSDESSSDDTSKDDKKSDDGSSDSSEPKKDEDEDIGSAADDKDALKNLVGDSNDSKTASESFRHALPSTRLFRPLKASYNKYLASLESFSLPYKLAIEEQPVVYVKDSVSESLNDVIKLANTYIENNIKFINSVSTGVKSLNEKITIYRTYHENGKISFNFKLISDKDILANVSVTDKSDIRDTVKTLSNYLISMEQAVNLLLTNKFDVIKDCFIKSNFKEEEGILVYSTMLPGFNTINVSIPPYIDYVKTDINNFNLYKLKTLRTDQLFNLNSIEITKDNDLENINTYLDKILLSITANIDNLNTINESFTKFIDGIKIMIHDVEHDKITKLSQLGIDEKIKEFIIFKLVMEICYTNVNLSIDYLSAILSIFDATIELKS